MVTEGNLLVGQNSCKNYEIRQQLLPKHFVSNKYNKILVKITETSGRLPLVQILCRSYRENQQKVQNHAVKCNIL